MAEICPISDLRNHFSRISRYVHEKFEPVFLTKNGHGNMVVMSMEYYEKLTHERDIHRKLMEEGNEKKKED